MSEIKNAQFDTRFKILKELFDHINEGEYDWVIYTAARNKETGEITSFIDYEGLSQDEVVGNLDRIKFNVLMAAFHKQNYRRKI